MASVCVEVLRERERETESAFLRKYVLRRVSLLPVWRESVLFCCYAVHIMYSRGDKQHLCSTFILSLLSRCFAEELAWGLHPLLPSFCFFYLSFLTFPTLDLNLSSPVLLWESRCCDAATCCMLMSGYCDLLFFFLFLREQHVLLWCALYALGISWQSCFINCKGWCWLLRFWRLVSYVWSDLYFVLILSTPWSQSGPSWGFRLLKSHCHCCLSVGGNSWPQFRHCLCFLSVSIDKILPANSVCCSHILLIQTMDTNDSFIH